MKAISRTQSLAIPSRALINYLSGKPLIVIFEVTLSCNARCRHCNIGGNYPNEKRLAPEEYRSYISEMRPAIVQLSGGEPLLREDLPEIVESIKLGHCMPYVIVVTNGSLLNEEKYLELKSAGVDRFSVSLDFPNEKHDEFRRLRGLYAHLEKTLPLLASYGNGDIAVNCAITQANMMYLEELAYKCSDWNISISYSAYSMLRTGDPSYLVCTEGDLKVLQKIIRNLVTIKHESGTILNSTSTLLNIYDFFQKGGMPGCKAGRRFLFVQPDGAINPCSMHRGKRYHSRKEMIELFSSKNRCKQCYVACRAYTDKSLWSLSKDLLEYARY
jgi:MoaA/NifB/PqqE/SkfB family radical SAM enzyme